MSATAQNTSPGERLDSWKEIAAYLNRGVRTVKRWETEEGLPVHRHIHRRLGSVYAIKSEVDAWLLTRGAQVAAGVESDEESPPPPLPVPRRGAWLAVGAAAILILAGYLAVSLWRRAPSEGSKRVMLAVLPFDNLSGDPDQEFFSDGLTEELITELGQFNPERLGLIARTSVMPYKTAKKSVRRIASELRIDYVLEGSVRREAERVRITAQLIRASDETHVWAQTYDRELSGIFDVQSRVVRAIADQVQVTLDRDAQAALRRSLAVHPEAYEAALRGRYFLDRRTADDLRRALDWFQRAVAIDARYALAYVGLADAHMLSATYADVPAKEAMTKAREAVLTALALDDQLPAAHAWLGIIQSEYDWDWMAAERQFRRAIELNPNYAYAHKLYAEYLSYVGRFDAAVTEARLARDLDPLSIVTNTLVGLALYRARQYDAALLALSQAIEMDPNHPMAYLPLGLVHIMKGQLDEAIAALMKASTLTPESSEIVAQLAHAHALAGHRDRTRAALDDLLERSQQQHVSPFSFALIHTGLGESQAAIDWLERAYDERDWYLCVLKTEPILDPLRNEPRFQALLRRMNFPN
jgi:TolB-like protein/tetratricopeptide (TPR) repeat protein